MITYTETPSISAIIIDNAVAPPTLDGNGGQILYRFTCLKEGVYALDMTIYISVGGLLTDCTTLLTKNGVLQNTNPNYNHRLTLPTTEEATYSHKAKISLVVGDIVYFGGYTSSASFNALLINGAMIVLKVG